MPQLNNGEARPNVPMSALMLPPTFRLTNLKHTTCRYSLCFLTLFALICAVLSPGKAFAQAEIELRSFSPPVDIVSGDTTPSAADRTDFGILVPGRTSDSTFVISNTGNQDLNFSSNPITLTGPGASRFSVRNSRLERSLAPGETTQFGVRYQPLESTEEQIFNAMVNISSDDSDENPFTFAILATTSAPTGPPQVEIRNRTGSRPTIPNGDISPSTAKGTDFGEVLLNSISRNTNDIQIRNVGGDILKLATTPVSASGPHAGDFRPRLSLTTPVPPGNVRGIDIIFRPSGLGLRTATISVATNAPDDNPYTFQVQGIGVAPPPVDSLEIQSGNNQATDTDTRYDNLEVLVKDADGEPIPGLVVTFSAPNNGASLSTQSSQATTQNNGIARLFRPRSNDIAGAFTVTASVDGQSVEFNLENTMPAVTPREINLTSNSPFRFEEGNIYNIGVLQTGQTAFDTFAIRNLGTEVLTLGPNPVSITGPDATEFRISGQPDETVPGLSNTRFLLFYEPTRAGVKTATLTINNDDADESPLVFTLKVETLAPTSPPEIEIRNGSLVINNGDTTPSIFDQTDFGPVVLGASRQRQEYSIFNIGGDVLSVPESGIRFTGPDADDFSFGSGNANVSTSLDAIPPGLRYNLAITFRPGGLGLRTATISIPNNDTDESPYTFQVSGLGVARLVVASGADQNSAISRRFKERLVVRAEDTRRRPLSGVTINFIAPGNGASASLSAPSAVTDANGLASVLATANSTLGTYDVSASSAGSNSVTYSLNNLADRDSDGVADIDDNCPDDANTNQNDVDGDLIGDACDGDADNDTIDNTDDNCPLVPNTDQADENPDTPEGDVCELADELCLPINTSNNDVAVICI